MSSDRLTPAQAARELLDRGAELRAAGDVAEIERLVSILGTTPREGESGPDHHARMICLGRELIAELPADVVGRLRGDSFAAGGHAIRAADLEALPAREQRRRQVAAERDVQQLIDTYCPEDAFAYRPPPPAKVRPPDCQARRRTRPRARGRRERRTVRSSARSGDSGSSEPPGLAAGRRCSAEVGHARFGGSA